MKAGGAACSTPSTGDELNEGFGDPQDNVWVAIAGGGTYDHTLQAGYHADTCGKGVLIADPGDGTETGIYVDLGSALGDVAVNICMDVYFNTITLPVNGDAVGILTSSSDTTWDEEVAFLELVNDSGTFHFRGNGHDAISGTTAITTGVHYKVCLLMDADGGENGSSATLGGVEELVFDSNDADASDHRYIGVGPIVSLAGDEQVSMEVGYLYVSTP